jgi:hypothetical protein
MVLLAAVKLVPALAPVYAVMTISHPSHVLLTPTVTMAGYVLHMLTETFMSTTALILKDALVETAYGILQVTTGA